MRTPWAAVLPPPRWRPLLALSAVALWPGLQLPVGDGLGGHMLLFCLDGLALVPVAMALSAVVEQLIEHLGPRWGGLLSVMFGNIVEFLIAFNALSSGLYPLVVMSIAGAVAINCLPVLGLAIVVACRGGATLAIDPDSRELQNQQLLLSALLLALPSVFFRQPLNTALQGNEHADAFSLYSSLVAVLALLVYGLAVFETLRQGADHDLPADHNTVAPSKGGLGGLLSALAGWTVLVALISDHLVGTLERLIDGSHLNALFVGLFLLPLFGSLPEALITLKAARRRLSAVMLISTIDSSLQLLLFVLPLLVLCGLPLGRYLHLGLPPVALAVLAVAVLMIERITENHVLKAYEGVQLVVLFVAMALGALLLSPVASLASA